jgi:hypothetical protein
LIYLVGSLRNPRIPEVAAQLRLCGLEVFDSWYSAGEFADDAWQAHEKQMGHTYAEALQGAHAQNVFSFDKRHLELCDSAVLVAPAGKSAHLELGWMLGQGKPGYLLLDGEPARFDVMSLFATGVYTRLGDLVQELLP